MKEATSINENQILIKKYEEKLKLAVHNYKKISQRIEFAFDSYEEECIKDEMNILRDEVKFLRKNIDDIKILENPEESQDVI